MSGAERDAGFWIWKLAGVVLLAVGVFFVFLPGLLPDPEAFVYGIFYAGAIAFAAMGVAFLASAPAPSTFACPSCGRETRKRKFVYFCPGCGRAMDEGEDELKPGEILCPHCDGVIQKKPGVCSACGKALPGFGVETLQGETVCRWCKHEVKEGEKFCKFCSAPLAPARL